MEPVFAPGGKPPIKKWSFSAIRQFERCGYRTFLQRVERMPVPQPEEGDETDPRVRGDRVHTEAERAIRGEGPITRELRRATDTLERLQKGWSEERVEVEQNWGVTREWESCTWDDPDCWGMIKLDVCEHVSPIVIRAIDWKTGKSMGKEVDHTQQMQLYAVACFMRYPDVQIVEAELHYLDEARGNGCYIRSKTYTRAVLPALLPQWNNRGTKLTSAIAFIPKPNRGNCRFCDFGRLNGTGVCPYDASGD